MALLLEPPKNDAEAERRRDVVSALASEAVHELECAVHVGGSRKIAAQWDWILREDPDLSGLRPEADFLRFESERFPYSQPAPLRPTEIVRLVAARHSAQLCSASAAIREQEWHRRADQRTATDPHDALAWWEEETEAWRAICELARDHRSWQTRLDLIRQVQAFCSAHGLDRFAAPRPPYSNQPIQAAHHEIDILAGREIQHLDQRISALHKELEDHDHPRRLAVWERYLQRLDEAGQPLDAETTRRLANNRACAWGDLRIAMGRCLTEGGDLHAATLTLKTAAAMMAALPLPRPPHNAAASRRRRVLVVANRTLHGEELRAELLMRGHTGADFHVVAPTLALRNYYDTTDTDCEIAGAQDRLRDALAWAERYRLRLTGAVGEPDAGMGAIVDELRHSGADDILVATLPRGRSNWIANGLVDHVAVATGTDVDHLVCDLRVHISLKSRNVTDAGGDPAEVVSAIDALLNGSSQRFDRRGDDFLLTVSASPVEQAAAIRARLRKQLPDFENWILVTPRVPERVRRPVITRVSAPPTPASRPGRTWRWPRPARVRENGSGARSRAASDAAPR